MWFHLMGSDYIGSHAALRPTACMSDDQDKDGTRSKAKCSPSCPLSDC